MEPKHCDDYINDPNAPEILRQFLDHARSPGHGFHRPDKRPKLFATYIGDEPWRGIEKGDRVRVVMASRMGDVGVTKDHAADHGYEARFFVHQLDNFSSEP